MAEERLGRRALDQEVLEVGIALYCGAEEEEESKKRQSQGKKR